jgi:hypothetical protein
VSGRLVEDFGEDFAAAEHRSSGHGIVIWSELVRRARAAGFDGMADSCVEGEAMHCGTRRRSCGPAVPIGECGIALTPDVTLKEFSRKLKRIGPRR